MSTRNTGKKEIKVISYVHVGNKLVEFSQLTPEQKQKAATILKMNYLNALYAGKAKFYPADPDYLK